MSSYFIDIEHHIINQIRKAKSRILVAVAWFTNSRIGEEIIKKKSLDVEIIVDENDINAKSKILNAIKGHRIEMTMIKDLQKKYYIMHNKFCVIDNGIVITGSYNWTNNANSNDENITIIKNSVTAAEYTQEFRRLKSIKFPNEAISMSQEEIDEIVSLIYSSLVKILKENITNLKKGMIRNYQDERVLNRIRRINEKIKNTLNDKSGKVVVYYDLIAEYGFSFNEKATIEEKVLARDKFRKKKLDKLDEYTIHEFQFLKIRAIREMQENYRKLLPNESQINDKVKRILKVHEFLTRERVDIANDLNLTMF